MNKVPDYILRQLTQPWGRKFPKRPKAVEYPAFRTSSRFDGREEGSRPRIGLPKTEDEKNCSKCGFAITNGGVFYPDKSRFHFTCDRGHSPGASKPVVIEGTEVEPYRPPRMRDWRSQRSMYDDIPDGNLDNSEYQYWVGDRIESSGGAECRACHKRVNGKVGRIEHKKIVDSRGDACTTRLVQAYKVLSQGNKCVICHEQTWNRRWGAPICPSVKCIARFMFEPTHWVQLEVALMAQDSSAPKIVDAVRISEDPDGWAE